MFTPVRQLSVAVGSPEGVGIASGVHHPGTRPSVQTGAPTTR